MDEGYVKLQEDLAIAEAMVAEMEEYLMSEVLFWPMGNSQLPRLTLGGYHMRQYRLVALRDMLTVEEQVRLDEVVAAYNQALNEKIVRFEQRAHTELEARLRQWNEALRDNRREETGKGSYYGAAVETRAMIAALLDRLALPPYQLDAKIPQKLGSLDRNLHKRWHPGDFIWPDSWQPAYPKAVYWWLYGRPR